MVVRDENKLLDTLKSLALLTPEQVESIRIESARSGKDIVTTIISLDILDNEALTKAQAISLNLPYVDLNDFIVNQDFLKLIPKDIAIKYQVVPFGLRDGKLFLAMLDPNNLQAVEFVEKKSGYPVDSYLASDNSISHVLEQYQDISGEMAEALKNVSSEETEKPENLDKTKELFQDAPITRAVNTIIEYAVKAHASDIHIEPREKTLKVRYRIDGILHDTMTLPTHIHSALVSRIKILSTMKIDEHRVPQDGRFDVTIDGREIDLRVSLSPTVYGEKVVIRLLDKSSGVITLEELGIRGRAYKIIDAGSKRPHGMVLSTGPTGSGKSTTLYALLNKMNSNSVNIITLEDPVEYQVDGVNQIQVNNAVGLTFASGLRSILRQDPDIIMVGEIRDAETAGLAIQSALTGHTVLSTLHTNSAAGVLPRLLDMDIEPFLIASTVSTVIGQRLVRKICENCKETYDASPAMKEAIVKAVGTLFTQKGAPQGKDDMDYKNIPNVGDDKITLYRGKGCEKCQKTGYSGRVGIFEVFSVTDSMEKLLVTHATSADIQKQAEADGMVTMRQDGFMKALEGLTTIEEVVSKTTDE
jgi:type IV pilus assembly protein PilB